MRNFILATHGSFSEGIKESLKIIYGNTDNIFTVSAYITENVELQDQLKEVFQKINNDKETIVITDLFGGSVNNELIRYIESHSIHLLAGLNLPLLIELVSQSEYIKDTELLIENALETSKNSILYCNKKIKDFTEDDEF